MNFIITDLIGLKKKQRIYLRFAVESLSMFLIYIFGLVNAEAFSDFNFIIHLLNFIIWSFLYKKFRLHNDRLRFGTLQSYASLFYQSFTFNVIVTIQLLIFTGKINIFASIFVFLLMFNVLIGLRIMVRQLIRKNFSKSKESILVYGTSDQAIDLYNAMAFSKRYKVVAFITENGDESGSLAGLPVISLDETEAFARKYGSSLVVLATPTEGSEQAEFLQVFDKLGLSVSYAPTMDRAFDYEVKLKAVKPEEVLGRPQKIEFDEAVQSEVYMKTLLVTGAGGSIGSELCRQILRYNPKKLIVLEVNEYALYTLESELADLLVALKLNVEIIYVLGSVLNASCLNNIFETHSIDSVYHAAAYKHVPIVEQNVISGVNNNVFGTKLIAEFAHRFNVEKFVLVSTDKAVRPTNVMGASKRVAELIIQDFSKFSETTFTMVRFGNVLGSSGSVIPKFKSQINSGGPVTVTHHEITRFFMSIPEASHLVLSAAALGNGGEVFLLDMGDPVKITELAKTMIRQHGLRPVLYNEMANRDKKDNEMLIEFTGLRPGEKIYEELLVDGIAVPTSNKKIFKAIDSSYDKINLDRALLRLEEFISNNDEKKVLELLRKMPISYQPNSSSIPDYPLESVFKNENRVEDELQSDNISIRVGKFRPSLVQRLVSSKLGSVLLHRYFLVTRGMTLGVRILIKNRQGEILLVEHTYIPGWYLPGGGVDHGETLLRAAIREVREETGITKLENLKFAGMTLNKSVSIRDHVAYFVAFTNEIPAVEKTPEIAQLKFVPISDLDTFLSFSNLNDLRELRII